MANETTLPGRVWVDDSSSWVSYTPASAWGFATDPGRELYENTYHFSVPSSGLKANATAVFTFPKPGTGFEWHGLRSSQGGLFAVCVDCNSHWLGLDWTIVDTLANSAANENDSVLLYSMSGLSNDIHNVSICNYWDERTKSWGELTVDGFVIQGSSASMTNVQTSPFPTASSTSIGLSGMFSSTSAFSSAPTAAPAASVAPPTAKLGKAQIAGIVVGSSVMLALVALLIAYCMMRSRSSRVPHLEVQTAITPGNTPHALADAHARTAFGMSLFTKKDPKAPTPFILPTMAEVAHPPHHHPYLHHSAPPAGYAHSINPPTVSEAPSPPQSPTKEEEGIRRWPSLSTSSGEVENHHALNRSVSSFSSMLSSLRLPTRKRSQMNAEPPAGIRLQAPAAAHQPSKPRNTKFFVTNASPAPRPIPEESPIPEIPNLPGPAMVTSAGPPTPEPVTAGAGSHPLNIRPQPEPPLRKPPEAGSIPSGRRTTRSPPPRSGKRAMGPRPLSSPQPSAQARKPST